jgi:hypothetical protein
MFKSFKMKLEATEIVKILEKPCKAQEILEGRRYESRLRLFTESRSLDQLKHEFSWIEYKNQLKEKLSGKKYDKICEFINLPLPIIDISDSCIKEIYKVFDARNIFFNHTFKNVSQKDFIEPKLTEMNIHNWIVENGKKVIKNKPNSIVVIDIDEKGNPYLLLVDSDRLVDFKLEDDSDTELEYVAFLHSVTKENDVTFTRVCWYDDYSYRIFLKTSKDDKYALELEIPHTAKECPARMFMDERLNSKSEYDRKIPFSNVISKMKEWQNFDTYKYYTDHYASFPILEAPESKCSNDSCEGGKIKNEHNHIENGETVISYSFSDCEVCKSKSLIGPGTVIRIKPKLDKDDPSESGVFKMISNPVENLQYIDEKLEKIEAYITLRTVGLNKLIQDQAINEKQVAGSYDTRQNVLLSLKTNFDNLYVWIVKTTSALLFDGSEVDVDANFGTEFYLLSEADLQERFNNAKKIGLPDFEIDSIFKQLIDTKYKGNLGKIDRAIIMKYIDPLPYSTNSEALNLFNAGLISEKDLILKIQLISFVDRFEMEQAPLIQFGNELNGFVKIQKIKEILNTYTDEQIKSKQVSGS